jgi:hypothetical protein
VNSEYVRCSLVARRARNEEGVVAERDVLNGRRGKAALQDVEQVVRLEDVGIRID